MAQLKFLAERVVGHRNFASNSAAGPFQIFLNCVAAMAFHLPVTIESYSQTVDRIRICDSTKQGCILSALDVDS